MRVFLVGLLLVELWSLPVIGAPGDQWVLGIHHINDLAQFTVHSGTGYSGQQSSGDAQFVGKAYRRAGAHGQARIYWELSGNSIDTNRPVPTTAELYTIEYFGTPAPGNDWQPIESQFNGAGGETFPIDSDIPWVGAFGTNHQYIGEDGQDDSLWHLIDNNGDGGPNAPTGPEFDAPENGHYMWLTRNSWLYAKWDFSFSFNRSWSAIRLTQITGSQPPDGDFNEDGFMDAADYVTWRKGNIEGEEGYAAWVANFGEPVAGGSAAVPEPTCAVTMIAGLLGLARFSARSRRNGHAWSRF